MQQGEHYEKAFLGTGWSFPVEADAFSGQVRMASEEEDIAQAIRIILMTRKGERVMRPDFGCRIFDFAFGTTDYTALSRMKHAVEEALDVWEPRIVDVEASVEVDDGMEGRLLISVQYRVRSTNNPYNLVFPFYLNEGFAGE